MMINLLTSSNLDTTSSASFDDNRFVVILVGYLIAVQFHIGFAGIAIGIALSAVTRAVPTMLKFWKGNWKTITL
jgi:Na+-driven multidrug efflux pump